MTFWDWAALVYVVVGLVLAAVVYHAYSGGMDDWFADEPHECEDCGRVHVPSEEEREIVQRLNFLGRLRESPRGRVVVAVVAAVLCLAMTLGWPVVIGFVVVKSVRNAKSRR